MCCVNQINQCVTIKAFILKNKIKYEFYVKCEDRQSPTNNSTSYAHSSSLHLRLCFFICWILFFYFFLSFMLTSTHGSRHPWIARSNFNVSVCVYEVHTFILCCVCLLYRLIQSYRHWLSAITKMIRVNLCRAQNVKMYSTVCQLEDCKLTPSGMTHNSAQ